MELYLVCDRIDGDTVCDKCDFVKDQVTEIGHLLQPHSMKGDGRSTQRGSGQKL